MRFRVHALDARQQVVALSLDAASEAAARELARGRGLEAFSISQKTSLPTLRLARSAGFRTTLFSVELMSLLEAGLNLVEALQTLAEKEGAGERREILASLSSAIHRGEPFSQAVAALPQHFPPLYVATVKAAERTGSLKEALGRYLAYQEELERVRKKVVSASIYPAILLAVGGIVLAFLMFYVVPRFAQVYEEMSSQLPFFSRLLLLFGRFVGAHAAPIAFASLLVLGAAIWGFTRPALRAALNRRLWQIPAIGERLKVYQLARLYRTVGMLLRAGIPAMRALEMSEELLALHLREHLRKARSRIREGRPMSAALGEAGLATPVATRMMLVGERSGDMGRMLGEIARFHDEEVARALEWFTKAFEPVLMALLGGAIGLVVVLMYMPIFELAGNIR
ncbi:MAG TPA: type II secretion system F family protein [Burkholderiales bacterium]|nr:type II secretion system F family protein [Burkholderiales bacterium]